MKNKKVMLLIFFFIIFLVSIRPDELKQYDYLIGFVIGLSITKIINIISG